MTGSRPLQWDIPVDDNPPAGPPRQPCPLWPTEPTRGGGGCQDLLEACEANLNSSASPPFWPAGGSLYRLLGALLSPTVFQSYPSAPAASYPSAHPPPLSASARLPPPSMLQ